MSKEEFSLLDRQAIVHRKKGFTLLKVRWGAERLPWVVIGIRVLESVWMCNSLLSSSSRSVDLSIEATTRKFKRLSKQVLFSYMP